MASRVALLAVLLLASSASAVIEVQCPDGMTWYGTAWEKCPCCKRCGDGWIVEGEECDPAAVLPASVEVEGEGEFGLGLFDTIILVPYIVPSLVAYRRRAARVPKAQDRLRAALSINARRPDRDAINIIYKSLQRDREQADISGIIRQLHEVIDEAIETTSDPVAEGSDPYDISRIDFDRLKRP